MKRRELIWMCLALLSSAMVAKNTFFPEEAPILNDLNPSVKSYIDRKMSDALPASENIAQLRGRVAALEGRLAEAQKLAADADALEAKQKKVEEILAELRGFTPKALGEARATELQWLKANVIDKCLGLTLKTASGKSLSPPPLPADILKPKAPPKQDGPRAVHKRRN